MKNIYFSLIQRSQDSFHLIASFVLARVVFVMNDIPISCVIFYCYLCGVKLKGTSVYDIAIHNVEVRENTILANIIGAGIHGVNSYHHQAIKELADGLEAMAISEDGLVESIEIKNQKFAIAVQWHPEFSYDSSDDSKKIMKAFVDSCM